ncbi:hypothetical protein SAMN05443999_11564 [Roseovarius azorensis]|uniref:Uncharacterized protein n=1 Tax=Roseovarius azorensis TaxID=1287727 RepID=A0A1H7WH61_9RHOB|nr:hypothetical protein [Roseovarius azorensis]SEM20823.1 hypothetical protein SAMN05443999_11564 [Roseovarius azorensis]
MLIDRNAPPPRQDIYKARASRARGWAWLVGTGLVGCMLVAIWQEPALSPKVHAGMQLAANSGEQMIARNEQVQAFLTRRSSAAQSATGERTDPVSAMLQKINN